MLTHMPVDDSPHDPAHQTVDRASTPYLVVAAPEGHSAQASAMIHGSKEASPGPELVVLRSGLKQG